MKYLITEKPNSLVIFMDVFHLKTLCQIADLIEVEHPESVIEVTHNFNTKQGSIILKKESIEFIDEIKEIIDP